MSRAQGGVGGDRELLAYVAVVAVPLLVGLTIGVTVLLSTHQGRDHPRWAWEVAAVVAATAAMSVYSWARDRRRTTRALGLAGGTRRPGYVEALLSQGLLVPDDGREVAEQVAGAQLQNRWVRVLVPVLVLFWLGTVWTKEGLTFWTGLGLPVLLLPTWARDQLRRRAVLRSAAAQGIVPYRRPRTPIPW